MSLKYDFSLLESLLPDAEFWLYLPFSVTVIAPALKFSFFLFSFTLRSRLLIAATIFPSSFSVLTPCFFVLIYLEFPPPHSASVLKRKRGKASASEIIEYVAKSLDTCLQVLEQADIAFKGMHVARYLCLPF